MTGPDLRRLRARLGLTQLELARVCDVTQPMVAAWEAGRPMSAITARLLEILGAYPEICGDPRYG